MTSWASKPKGYPSTSGSNPGPQDPNFGQLPQQKVEWRKNIIFFGGRSTQFFPKKQIYNASQLLKKKGGQAAEQTYKNMELETNKTQHLTAIECDPESWNSL